MKDFDFSKIRYRYHPIRKPKTERDVTALGFDSEADRDGKTFMYCLSDGSVYTPETLLDGLFHRKHRGLNYAVYNLKYEQGAILQNLDSANLNRLRERGDCQVGLYKYKIVGYKSLRITRGKNAVTFWDMFPFFNMSLANASRHFTNLRKGELDVTLFTQDYVLQHWDRIRDYCIRDALITARLFSIVLEMSNRLGIKPTTFYSIATIGYKYVREHTNYVTAKYYWDNHREVLESACSAYSGGKFEVVTRGRGHFYEYDINSAYPYEYANLIDISKAKVVEAKEPPKGAVYGFVKCKLWIERPVSHSVAVKRRNVNIYPVGNFTKWLTKEEFEYISTLDGVEVKVIKAYWLIVRRKRYPYRRLINDLYKLKAEAKVRKDDEFYNFTKTLLNSVYGKLVQLVVKDGHYEASTCWMPIYGAIITANVRIRMSKLQNKYPSIVAVHTDSVISSVELPLEVSDKLGDWSLACYGLGIILGSGIYQVGDKKRFRGFPSRVDLIELLNKSPPSITIEDVRALSWREVVFHHWDVGLVNKFEDIEKHFSINFDTKRIWDDSWVDGDDALNRVIGSMPKIVF